MRSSFAVPVSQMLGMVNAALAERAVPSPFEKGGSRGILLSAVLDHRW
jgi:hypothetical protein